MEREKLMIFAELLASAVEYLCIFLVLLAFFSPKDRRWFTIGMTLLCGLFHIFLSSSDLTLWVRMPLALLNGLLVCEICFDGNFGKKLFILLLFWAVAFAIDMSVLTACTAIMDASVQTAVAPNAGYLFSMLSARSILLAVSFGCSHIVRRQKGTQKGSGAIWVCLLLIPLYTIVAVGALISNAMEGGVLSGGMVALSGGLLCINVILCLVVNRLEQNRLAEEEKQKFQTEAAHNLQMAKTYQDSFNQQRKITHEFRNQLDAVGNLLAQKEYDRAADYIRHLQSASQEVSPSVRTGHPMVDAVLNQKYQQAAQKEIGMLLYCNDLSAIPLEDGELVTLLGNLLDNAIFASAQTDEKQIWMRLWQEQGIYQLIVRNSCPEAPVAYGEQEHIFHGFGMGLVSTVLEKYDYPYYADRIGTQFVFSAILG